MKIPPENGAVLLEIQVMFNHLNDTLGFYMLCKAHFTGLLHV